MSKYDTGKHATTTTEQVKKKPNKIRVIFAEDDPSKVRGTWKFRSNVGGPVRLRPTGPAGNDPHDAPMSPSEKGRPGSPNDMRDIVRLDDNNGDGRSPMSRMMPNGQLDLVDLDLNGKAENSAIQEPGIDPDPADERPLPEVSVGDSSDDSQSSIVHNGTGRTTSTITTADRKSSPTGPDDETFNSPSAASEA